MEKIIVMSDTFMSSNDKLSRKDKKIVLETMRALIDDIKGIGLQVHKLDRTRCDDSFRSARCNKDLRIIFSDQGDKIILLYVDNHDDAYKWAEGKSLNINNFGSLILFNSITEKDKSIEAYNDPFQQFNTQEPILEKVGLKIKDLTKLGIEKVHAEILYEIKDEDRFIDFISVYPEEIQEALLDLAAGTRNMTEVHADLFDDSIQKDHTLDSALNHKDTRRRFVVVESITEMENILEGDFERWKLFLHPKQKDIVEKNFNGPAIIQGGPGTGKTVVAIHRAVYLSKNIHKKSDNKKILICTFNKKLAFYITEKLELLIKKEKLNNNIEVRGVDSLFYEIRKNNNLTNKRIDLDRIDILFRSLYTQMQPEEPILFYQTEYKEVIQKYGINSLDEYLKVQRKGLGKALQPSKRKEIWSFFDRFRSELEEEGIMDFEDQAYIVQRAIDENIIDKQYDSIIVDESQDLSPVKLKVLYSLVRSNNNSFFLLYDPNQTIYQLTTWRKDIEIDVIGRSHFLYLNYRTTKQIKEYAEDQFIFTEKILEHMRSYKSVLSGPYPEVQEFNDFKKQVDYVILKINNWISLGMQPFEIGVILASNESANILSGVLTYKNIKNTILEGQTYPTDKNGVGLVTVQGCKGLEFRAVILVNYTDIDWNNEYQENDDWYYRLRTRQIECQRYVATTRAREELVVTFML